MRKLLRWIKPSFEAKDGKASITRILAVIIALAYIACTVWFVIHTDSPEYGYYALLTSSIVFTVMLQIIYPHHLIEAIKAAKRLSK